MDWVAVAKTAPRANDATAAATTTPLSDVFDLEGRSVWADASSAGTVLKTAMIVCLRLTAVKYA